MRRGSRTFCGLLLACGLPHNPAHARQAQADTPRPTAEAAKTTVPPVSTPAQQRLVDALNAGKIKLDIKAKPLADIVDSLAAQLHCSILVDDDPLLADADVQCDGTGKDALDKVADTFDYTWEASKSGGVLMRKRFRSPGEHPQMNYAELRQMAHDAVTILDTLHFNPQYYEETWPYIIRELYESFTPEQRVIMTDETKRLTMQQLAPAQRALVEKAIYCSGYQDQIRAWNAFANELDALPQSWMQRASLHGILRPSTATAIPTASSARALDLHLPLRGGREKTVGLMFAFDNPPGKVTKEKKP